MSDSNTDRHSAEDPLPPDFQQSGHRRGGASGSMAFAGIGTALILLLLTAVWMSPTADLVFYTLSSFVLMLVRSETGWHYMILSAAAAALLAFALLGIVTVWPFLVFFGPWPMLKGAIEQRMDCQTVGRWALALTIKLPLFAALLGLAWGLFGFAVMPVVTAWQMRFGIGPWLLASGALLGCLLYDAVLSGIWVEYNARLRPYLTRRRR